MERKEHQPPLAVEAQIENLKELGLTIENEDEASSFLQDVSYFRFIKAYSLGLKPKNGKYHDGVTFNRLKQLYLFNCNFRQLLFPLIEHIEINLRCRIANCFCIKYGVMGYQDPANFAAPEYHAQFMKDIQVEIACNERQPL